MGKQLNNLGIRESQDDRYVHLDNPNSCFRYSHHIEGLCVSENITVEYRGLLPFPLGIEEHRTIIIEVNTINFIGESPVKMSSLKGRRLNLNPNN